jgi:hypothetical protein
MKLSEKGTWLNNEVELKSNFPDFQPLWATFSTKKDFLRDKCAFADATVLWSKVRISQMCVNRSAQHKNTNLDNITTGTGKFRQNFKI